MELETDFNRSPFWDDYDENKNFYRILYRPGVPVQARELTQSQTILQDQIERFGQNIYKDGTIISGSNFTFDAPYPYVKILDLQTDGQPVNASQYVNTILKNSANLTAIVQSSVDGLESQNPDLNTLYVKYLNKGLDGKGVFANSEVISAYTKDYGILRVEVADGGTGYSNSDMLVFTSGSGEGAAGRVITNAVGTVTDIVVTAQGNGYISVPLVSIANSTGGAANGSGVQLLANNVVGQVTVASNTFVVTGNTDYNPTGAGYAFRVSEGVVFQKGFFIRVEPQSIVVSKYSTSPTDVHVGFNTEELVVNNSIDTSLLDNAQGSSNENAPGAYRLKLVPRLVTKNSEEVRETPNFFSLVQFQDGRPIKQHQTPEFNSLGNEMAKRTSEESGNYVIQPFTIVSDDITGNTTHIQARIGSGTAYVNGFRVQQYDTYSVPVRRGNDVQLINNAAITTNYGSYVLVTDLRGTIPFSTNAVVDVLSSPLDQAQVKIGTARVRNIAYHNESNGIITYRLYVYDIRMNSGKSFDSAKSIYLTNGGMPNDGAAALVLEAGKAVVKESAFAPMIFRFGQKAVKTLRGEGNVNDTSYVYTTIDTSTNFAANGYLQKNLTGGDTFPYNGQLNDVEERDVIFIARNSANSVNLVGTVTANTTSNVVTGVGTAFLSDFVVGDYFAAAGTQPRRITSIANNTTMTLASNGSAAVGGVTFCKHFPANEVVPFTSRDGRTISASGSVLTANLGVALTNVLNVNSVYNVRRAVALQLTKNINKGVLVKINTTTHTSKQGGPWCLGLPDVLKVTNVTMRQGGFGAANGVDVTAHFTLDTGQKDTYYGLAWLRKKSTSKLVIPTDAYLTVSVDTFTHTDTGGGIGFFSVDSYPVDDVTVPQPATAIKTQDIPVYTSPVSGAAFDLRDAVDFRPVVNRTANNTTVDANATVNPSAVEAFASNEKYVPAVNKSFTTDLQYYQGRYDIIALTSYGQYDVKEGVPSDTPTPPAKVTNAMNIATVSVPPYPTLPTKIGSAAGRPDYTVKISTKQNKRYTMEDIGQIDRRLDRVEYYTALSLLEKQTSDLLIPSSIDPTLNRFKNGIFVDPFSNFSLGNILDGEYTAGIDEAVGELIPRFEQNKFDLEIQDSTGVNVNRQIATLGYTHVATLSQPYATRVRNCTENFWNFTGRVELTPSYDNFYDVKSSPENTIVIDVDNATPTLSLINEFNNMKALNTVDTTSSVTSATELTSSSVRGGDSSVSHWVDETYTTVTETTTTETKNMMVGQVSETVSKVGDFITDISFSPYIRASAVRFAVTGLKPNTAVNAFFDKVKVTGFCQEATMVPSTVYENSWKTSKGIGEGLITNEQGELFGIFFIPANAFFVGDRELKFLDVNELNSESAASTSASGMYHAYNFSVTKSDVVVSTRSVELSSSSSSTSTTSTTRDVTHRETFVEVPTPPTPPVVTPPVTPPVIGTETGNITFYGPGAGPARQISYFTNQPNLDYLVSSNGGGNRISSVVVNGNEQWMIYEGTGYTGQSKIVDGNNQQFHIGSLQPLGRVRSARRVTTATPPTGGGGGGAGGGGDRLDGMDRIQLLQEVDPIAQTFLVSRQLSDNQDGIYVTKVDLYFGRKDPNLGLTVQLRLTNNGYPAAQVLPMASVHVKSSQVNVSNDASAVTTVEFPTPIFLKSDQEYALVVMPDGNSPEYLIYTAQGGQTDLMNPSFTVRKDWGLGVLFTSTNNSAWQSIQDEDMKFNLHRAAFNTGSASITLTNKDDEFLTIGTTTNTFLGGEKVFKFNIPIVGTASFSVGSKTITGVGTTFQNTYVVGQQIVLSDSDNPTVNNNFDIVTITNIANNTSLTIDIEPKFTADAVKIFNTPIGEVFFFDAVAGEMILTNSTAANTSFRFAGGDVIVGETLKGTTTISSVNNKKISYFQPLVYRTALSGTEINGTIRLSNQLLQLQGARPIKFNDSNYITTFEAYVGSRSNEIAAGGNKSVRMDLVMKSNNPNVSPTLDLQATSILRYENLINDSQVGETGINGDTESKYVSKTVTLKDGLDAEDIVIYATGYQPSGTEIAVYIRALNAGDPDNLRDKAWTKLTPVANTACDTANRNDFKEFEYRLSESAPTQFIAGVANVSNNNTTVTGIDTTFVADIAAGDVIQLGEGSDAFVSKVAEVTDDTTLVLVDAAPKNYVGADIAVFDDSKTIFRNWQNDGVMTYYGANSRYETYKTFAIKVGLLAPTTNLVPRLKDLSAIALSI